MRWAKILLAVNTILLFSSGMSAAQSSLTSLVLTSPAFTQPFHRISTVECNQVNHDDCGRETKPLAMLSLEFDRISRMQRLTGRSA